MNQIPTGSQITGSQTTTGTQSVTGTQTPSNGNQPSLQQVAPKQQQVFPTSQPLPSLSMELSRLQQKIQSTQMPKDLAEKALGAVFRLQQMAKNETYSKEYESISEYVNWITSIPWGKVTQDNLDLKHAAASLNENHYGLDDVKNRILEYLATIHLTLKKQQETAQQQNLSDEMKRLQGASEHAPVLCFVGIQGVGKTTMAKSIASALGRQFIRISLGGMGGVHELRGRSRGELDAEPGQVVKGLSRVGTMNPLILLDEIDKVSSQTGLRADIMASLLEILDPEQNSAFTDKYIDYPLDLSRIIFITTANNLGGISAALQDRLEIIRFGSYNDDEKIKIAKDYLLPKVRKATGIGEDQLTFDDEVWPLVVRPLGFDAGVRQLERTLNKLARKVALQIVRGTVNKVHLTKDNFREFIPEEIGVYG